MKDEIFILIPLDIAYASTHLNRERKHETSNSKGDAPQPNPFPLSRENHPDRGLYHRRTPPDPSAPPPGRGVALCGAFLDDHVDETPGDNDDFPGLAAVQNLDDAFVRKSHGLRLLG